MSALTPQQNSVMILACSGHSMKTMADRLGLSPHTVKFHITRAMSRLDASTRGLAVAKFTLMHPDWVKSHLVDEGKL